MENNRAENTGHGDTIDDSFTSLSKRLSFDYLNASFELSEYPGGVFFLVLRLCWDGFVYVFLFCL